MAAPSKTRQNQDSGTPGGSSLMTQNGFDIVATIGHVDFSSRGEMQPVEAAMRIIGQNNHPGVYRFPHEDGGEWVIEMSHDRMEVQAADDGYPT